MQATPTPHIFMRLLLKSLLWITGLGLVAALVLGLALALDRRPLVAEPAPPSPAEQTWAADWLAKQRRHHGRAASGNRLELTEPQANLLLNALLGRSGQGQAQVRLDAQVGRVWPSRSSCRWISSTAISIWSWNWSRTIPCLGSSRHGSPGCRFPARWRRRWSSRRSRRSIVRRWCMRSVSRPNG
jgi:hypothetical protein